MEKLTKAIGGYFELESAPEENFLHNSLLALNTARNGFEFILLARKYKHVYIPYFTCDVMLEPIEKLGLSYSFYDVDNNLEPIFDFSKIQNNDAFLITNYFGIKGLFIRNIAAKISNLIVDNAQALFDDPLPGIDTIYSPRKFVGVADGGYVSTTSQLVEDWETDESFERMSHLLKRADLGAEAGYEDFKINDAALEKQPIKKMSKLTRKILAGIDYEQIARIRRQNFSFFHEHLGSKNELKIGIDSLGTPMVYPFRCSDADRIRRHLLQNRIFCASYWPNVKDWCGKEQNAFHLTNEIVALPIDQRYGVGEIKNILKIINYGI